MRKLDLLNTSDEGGDDTNANVRACVTECGTDGGEKQFRRYLEKFADSKKIGTCSQVGNIKVWQCFCDSDRCNDKTANTVPNCPFEGGIPPEKPEPPLGANTANERVQVQRLPAIASCTSFFIVGVISVRIRRSVLFVLRWLRSFFFQFSGLDLDLIAVTGG